MRAKVLNWIFILLIISSGLSQAQNRVRYTAVPIDGYSFKSWDDGNTTNSRIINLSSIPAGLSSVPLVSVSEPITMTTIKLVDNILTSTRGVVLYEILDDNSDTPLNTLASSVSIPGLKAFFEHFSYGILQPDGDDLTAEIDNPCNSSDPINFIFKHVPSGNVTIDNNTFTTTYDYFMTETEITQAQWKYVMGCNNNPSQFNSYVDQPVEKVSWYEVLVYCNKLSNLLGLQRVYSIDGDTNEANWGAVPTSNSNKWNNVVCDWTAKGVRLPTHVEWMHAAKGGVNSSDTCSGSNIVVNVAWYYPNSSQKTHQVKKKTSNALGLYDMSGNVWEWCWDRKGNLPNGGVDYRGPSSGNNRVDKGGSYSSAGQNIGLRKYDTQKPSTKSSQRGFRVVIPK